MASDPKSRYHAKVRINWDGLETEINVFADSLDEVYHDLHTIAHVSPENVASALEDPLSLPPERPEPASLPAGAEPAPVCQSCGTRQHMQLIEFTDRETGQPKSRWKCAACQKWHWPNGKSNGRSAGRATAGSRG